jgi:hypothetical protein
MGSLYRRGDIWWVKYYVNGRPVRVSAETGKEKEAREFLKKREGKAAAGEPLLPRIDRIRYDEIEADLQRHYEATGRRNLKEYAYRVKHLNRVFAGQRVATIGQPSVDAYIGRRHEQGAASPTIKRELGTLRRMLRLAYKNGKLARLPLWDMPKDGAPREGFFERAQYEAVRHRLPADLQAAVTVAYTYGWRSRAKCLPSSAGSWTWTLVRCDSIRARPRTPRAASCISRQSARPS